MIHELWRGLSQLDGTTPVVLLATDNSENTKTGPMAQTWILRQDMLPSIAQALGFDTAICATCELRRALHTIVVPKDMGGVCYVNVHGRPDAIWTAWSQGEFVPTRSLRRWARVRAVRAGSYGDPTAIPYEIWDEALSAAPGHTGYTRQWRQERFLAFRKHLMASVFNEREKREANELGWRTYRVAAADETPVPGEVHCPSQTKNLTCMECLACNGQQYLKGNVMAHVHGASWKISRFHKLQNHMTEEELAYE